MEAETFLEILNNAQIELKKQFDLLDFDEQDTYPNLDNYLEKVLNRSLTLDERIEPEYIKLKKMVGTALVDAKHLTTLKKHGDTIQIAKQFIAYEESLMAFL